jgi:MFS transporter, DHA1 family, inner membrane transport protein
MAASDQPLVLSPWRLTALVIVVCTGFSSQMVVPIWLGQVIETFHIGAAAAGRIASTEFLTVAITSVIVASFVGRVPSRAFCVLGTLLLFAGNLASMVVDTVPALTAARMVCGLGKGLVIAIIFGLAGQTVNPTRTFAVLNAAYAAFSAAAFLLVPVAVKHYGMDGAFGSMVAITIAGLLCLKWVPQSRRDAEESWFRSLPRAPLGLLTLAGLTLMWTAHGSIWVFVERIGVRNGLTLQTIGMVLSAGAMLTVFGPLTSHLLEIKRGATLPVVSGLAVLAVAGVLLCLGTSSTLYVAAVLLFSLTALFVLPYIMGLLGYADPGGKLTAGASAFMTLGGSIGPLVGGTVIEGSGYSALAVTAALLVCVVIALILPLSLRHDARLVSAPAHT